MTPEDTPALVDQAISTALSLPASTIPTFCGYAAFASSLALSTLFQLKVLGISTGSPRPIPSLVGMASVAVSSLASHNAAVKAHEYCRQHGLIRPRPMTPPIASSDQSSSPSPSTALESTSPQQDTFNLGGVIQIDKQTLRICLLGMVSFKLLGGRFWAVAPSSFTHLGSFARFSLPANQNYASPAQRASIERLGRLAGCHTCGSHMMFRSLPRFHGDHQPPKAVAQQMNNQWIRKLLGMKVKFRFYPQCVDCSNIQGSILSKATNELSKASFWNRPNLKRAGGGKLAHFHGLRFRPFHLAGAVIGAVTVVNVTDEDVANGNRRRFREMQDRAEEFGHDVYDFIQHLIHKK